MAIYMSMTTPDFHYQEELKQSHARLIYIAIITTVLLFCNRYVEKPLVVLDTLLLLFTVASLLHLIFLKRYPDRGVEARRVAAIFLDVMVVTALVFFLEEYGFLFSILYLWIIQGNGIRFGVRYLYIAGAASLAGIALIYLLSPYWHARPDLVLYMGVMVSVLPLFTIKLLYRIQEKNQAMLELLEMMEQQSRYDSLTGVPNRFYFEMELKRRIEKGIPFSLFFIDLDGFKQVNDTMGHNAGDRVLKQVAARLERLIGRHDFVARLGGDEFVVIVDRRGRRSSLKVAESIVRALKRPYGANREIDAISASIGISDFPEDAKEEFSLKKYADVAMYEVKKRGKDGFLRHARIANGSGKRGLS